jgi:type VI protein secretion system component VasK
MNPNRPSHGALDAFSGLVRLAVALWVGWIILVSYVALWMESPALGVTVGVAVLVPILWLVLRRRGARRQRFAAYHAAKARQHQQDRLRRAQEHPDIVFEENAAQWAKELSRE